MSKILKYPTPSGPKTPCGKPLEDYNLIVDAFGDSPLDLEIEVTDLSTGQPVPIEQWDEISPTYDPEKSYNNFGYSFSVFIKSPNLPQGNLEISTEEFHQLLVEEDIFASAGFGTINVLFEDQLGNKYCLPGTNDISIFYGLTGQPV